MIGLSLSGKRVVPLNEEQFLDLCKRFEEQFDIEKKVRKPNEIHYVLKGSINMMKWVDSGTITLIKNNNNISVKFTIRTDAAFILSALIAVGFFLYQTFANHEVFFGLIGLVLPFLICILCFIAFQVFKFRIYNSINNISTSSVVLDKEHADWLNDLTKCPACGYEKITNEDHCPNCGLKIK